MSYKNHTINNTILYILPTKIFQITNNKQLHHHQHIIKLKIMRSLTKPNIRSSTKAEMLHTNTTIR